MNYRNPKNRFTPRRGQPKNEFLEYWKIAKKPFAQSPALDNFFFSRHHEEAFERLMYLVEAGGFGMGAITGDVGTGKTSLRHQLTRKLAGGAHQVVSLTESNLSFDEILKVIVGEIAGKDLTNATPSRLLLMSIFRKILTLRYTVNRRRLVITIDEAQELGEEALAGLKNLGNIANEIEADMTLILIGQTQLLKRISAMPEIEGRIGLFYFLPGILDDELEEYLAHRLRDAGHESGYIFCPESLRMLMAATRGVPRLINRIAALSLEQAFALESDITPKIVSSVIRDFEKQRRLIQAA